MIDDEAALKAAEYRALFATPLIVADLPDCATLCRELQRIIHERRETQVSAARSNKGGWQSDTDMLQWGGEPARQLGRMLLHLCANYTRDVGQTDDTQPRFEWSGEMWANICPAGGSHESHTHPGSLWSAVFYVDAGVAPDEAPEKAGALVVQDPRNPLPVMYKPDLRYTHADGSVYRSDHRITPRAGRVVAFPPWVAHWVTPHEGRGERVSIAMNLVALPARGV